MKAIDLAILLLKNPDCIVKVVDETKEWPEYLPVSWLLVDDEHGWIWFETGPKPEYIE